MAASAYSFLKNYASQYLTEGIPLTIILVSDEREQSTGTEQEVIDEFKKYLSKPDQLTIHSIVNLAQDTGQRYKKLSELTNGTYSNIHDPNFSTAMKKLGEAIAESIGNIKLKQKAYPESIVVKIEGVVVDFWTYNEADNTIVFDSSQGQVTQETNISISYIPRL
jgi:hypothetical protein